MQSDFMIKWKILLQNKRGSYTVLLVMVFSAMLILLFALLTASGKMAISSVTDSFGRLWGRSILAEYDLNLKARYGLFAYYGNPSLVEDKLDFYGKQTFAEKAYIDYTCGQCSLDAYRLADPAICKAQMAKAALIGSIPKAFDAKEDAANYGFRYIRNRSILAGLPSRTITAQPQLAGILDAIKQGRGFTALVGNALVDRYIFTYFKDYRNARGLGETYFRNEIEYILTGKADDERARKGVRSKLRMLRNALNLFYLYTCPEKKEAAMSLAMAITPGPEAVVTQGVLLEAWALAEAANDIKLLYADQPVPLLKKDQNWALSLDNAVGNLAGDSGTKQESGKQESGKEDEPYIAPPVIEGIDYAKYLQLLLCCIGEDTRVLRAMDLIQINMKYLYCDYFLLSDYYTGLRFSLKIDGKVHTFEETYEADLEKEE